MGNNRALFAALALAIALAILGTTPPRPVPASADRDAFSASRAMADVRRIARAPHPSGSAEHAALRDYLVRRLRSIGLETYTQDGVFPDHVRSWFDDRGAVNSGKVPLVNVIGVLPGRDRNAPALALMAHYDSVPGSPAAADDGAGIASILETLRVLAQNRDRRRDLIVVFTDGEEAGLMGARLFFDNAAEAQRIGAIVNLEARGGGGKANLFQTSAMNGDVVRVWAASASHPAGTSLATFIYSVLPNDTDLTIALPHGVSAWNFAFIGRPALYHSPLATAQRLDQGSLQQMGEQVLGLSRALLRLPALPGKAPDLVFFDVFGLAVVHYATWWGWAMLAAAFAGYGALLHRPRDWRALFGGGIRMIGLLAAAGGLLYGFNALSMSHDPVNYYDRLAAIPKLQAMIVGVCGAVVLAVMGRSPTTQWGEVGLALPLWIAGAAFQVLAPAAAYVLTVPLFMGAISAVVRARCRAPSGWAAIARSVSVAVLAGIVGGYALMLGFVLTQAVGPMIPMVALLPVAILCGAFVPLRPSIAPRPLWTASAVCICAAFAVSIWVRLDAPAASIPPYSEARAIGTKP